MCRCSGAVAKIVGPQKEGESQMQFLIVDRIINISFVILLTDFSLNLYFSKGSITQ
jgi:hypothetical protein